MFLPHVTCTKLNFLKTKTSIKNTENNKLKSSPQAAETPGKYTATDKTSAETFTLARSNSCNYNKHITNTFTSAKVQVCV